MRQKTRLSALLAASLALSSIAGVSRAEPAVPSEAQRDEARRRFEKGLTLLKDGALEAALAEFLASRSLAPTRGNTRNAAVVLRKLHRFDEALDMFEALQREFWDATQDERGAITREIDELRGLVGLIDVRVSEPGASVSIDGRERGVLPLAAPLRVSAGSHQVRIVRDGRLPLERRVEVAGGQTISVVGSLVSVAAIGRLRVEEATGAGLEVLIDGALAGTTPWEGPVAAGDHVVTLRGPAGIGTAPSAVTIAADGIARLRLAAARLDAWVRIESEPLVSIVVDGVVVGRGAWEGALPSGQHRLEARAPGLAPVARDVTLAVGARERIVIGSVAPLPVPARTGHVALDAYVGVALGGAVGGDLTRDCSSPCRAPVAVGPSVRVGAAYVFPSGVSAGLSVGYLRLARHVDARPDTIAPNGRAPAPGTASDDLTLSAPLVFGTLGVTRGERWVYSAQLGVGVAFASVRDDRAGTYALGGVQASASASQSASGTFAYAAPEARVGLRVATHIVVSASLSLVGLFALHTPTRASKPDETLLSTHDFATWPEQALTGSVLFVPMPSLGVSGEL